VKKNGEKEVTVAIYTQENLFYQYYQSQGAGTIGEVDSHRQPILGNELPVVPVVDRYYRSKTDTTGHPSVLPVVPAQQKISESW
jgi:hypothetical protein